jgi:hypothetical protein
MNSQAAADPLVTQSDLLTNRPTAWTSDWSTAYTGALLRRGGVALRAVLEQLEQGRYRRFHDLWSGLHTAAEAEARKEGWDGLDVGPLSLYKHMLGAIVVPLMTAADVRYWNSFSRVLSHRWDAGQLADVLRTAINVADRNAAEAGQ